ncbi:hypothetical protein TNCV_2647451 [Trichonephila clavipes]|nr:hypothetical protein TNCV_2647451 [Trichonephila clavipes]
MGWNQLRWTYGPAYHSEWHFDGPKDDNARPHRDRLVENMLEADTIQPRPRPPATVRDLDIALLEEWNSNPQSLIDNLIASMADRCAAVLAVRGDHTPY